MAKPWGGLGAWADESERAEAEEKERAASLAASGEQAAFPTLGESLSTKPKKKKPQTFFLSEFTVGKYVGPGGKSRLMSESRGLTTEEMMLLPTGPRVRSAEEEQYGGLGGGFRDYDPHRGGGGGMDRDRDRGFGGGFERERESGGYRRDRERDEPSRADENSNWAATKKPLPTLGGGGGYEEDRRGSRRSDRDLPSRADEDERWGSMKKPLPPAPAPADAYDRRGARYSERREGFDEGRLPASRADESESWATGKKTLAAPPPPERRAAGLDPPYREAGADTDRWSKRDPPREEPQRRRLVLAPRTRPLSISPPPGPREASETSYSNRPPSPSALSDSMPPPLPKPRINPFGSTRPREEILAERGQDWRRLDAENESKDRDSRPSSSHSSRPSTPDLSREAVARPRPKVNPFGDAKPREVLLEEKGRDWRKIDFELEHRAVDRPETEEEKKLKEEILALTEQSKQETEDGATKRNGVVLEVEGDVGVEKKLSAKEQLLAKEVELEQLIRALDDKVRFSQRVGERPRSRSGRADGRSIESERPGSRSGRVDIRSFDSLDRTGSGLGRGNGQSLESLERPGSRSGLAEINRSFDSLERSRPVRNDSVQIHEPSQEGRVAEVWTRSNEESGHDRRGSWNDRDRSDNWGRQAGYNRR